MRLCHSRMPFVRAYPRASSARPPVVIGKPPHAIRITWGVDILSAVLTDGLIAVEAAPHPKAADRLRAPEDAKALGDGVHLADVILNILARQREAGPPLRVAAPVALRLGCEPMADCARYDSLSGVG